MDHNNHWQLPVLTLAVSLTFFLAFHVQQVLREQSNLKQVYAAQEQPLAQAKEMQQRLDRLAVGTLRLAEGGNENANALVERLKQAGVTITPPKHETVGAPK
ncbi:MAG: hypothetical protein KBA75_02580 [Alphaproteobacteria bacterium]|nr:hypothetical protein [Alphaproteobacteria bacterium]